MSLKSILIEYLHVYVKKQRERERTTENHVRKVDD